MLRSTLLLALLGLLAAPACADTLETADGEVYEGTIISQTPTDYEFDWDGMVFWISKADVVRMELTDPSRVIPGSGEEELAGPIADGKKEGVEPGKLIDDPGNGVEPTDQPAAHNPGGAATTDEPLKGPEITGLLTDLGSRDLSTRQAAFDTFNARGDDKARARMVKEMTKKLDKAKKEFSKAVVDLGTDGVSSWRSKNASRINSLRNEMQGLLKQQRTKEMRPLYNELKSLWYPKPKDPTENEKYVQSKQDITWYSEHLSAAGEKIPSAAEVIKETEGEAQVEAIIKTASGDDKSAVKSVEGAKKFLSYNEYMCIQWTNEYRMMMGLQACKIDTKLVKATRMHSTDMVKHNFFNHTSPLPGKAHFRERAAMHGTTAMAENIAMQCLDWKVAFWGWFESHGHHVNMLRPNWSVIAIGEHETYYTECFR
jgi:uncharacterized protein YkwD